jgi:hypothetical protein
VADILFQIPNAKPEDPFRISLGSVTKGAGRDRTRTRWVVAVFMPTNVFFAKPRIHDLGKHFGHAVWRRIIVGCWLLVVDTADLRSGDRPPLAAPVLVVVVGWWRSGW